MVTEIKKNWFREHWIISIILGILFVSFMGGLFVEDENLTGEITNKESRIDSEQIEIQKDSKINVEDLNSMSISKKKNLCIELCAGEDISIPYIKSECKSYCKELYYYGGEEALNEEIESYS